ncbi:hypothetical protein LTR94_025834 [Friedmanniomyces endolithicus]|nr:hypothetical protein LTR94_025834 [Friedmanniomyces endolithicus]
MKAFVSMLALGAAMALAVEGPVARAGEPLAEGQKEAGPSEELASRDHKMVINGRTIAYKASAGTLIITDDDGVPRGSIFYTAYTAQGASAGKPRPLTFFNNGGPGSASLWLNVGGFGPKRPPTLTPKATLPAPYVVQDNPYSLLDKSDLIFIDAIGTGYSRPIGDTKGKAFWGVDADIDSFARAINRYITKNDRWNSPRYLFGESYGTTRSAMVSYRLIDSGMPVDGVILMSSILNFAQRAPGLDRMDINYLPSYAATAWYHDKVVRGTGLEDHVARARQFAQGPYAAALAKGQDIGAQERESELLRDRGAITGGFDTRFIGSEGDNAADTAQSDPADDAISGAIIANFSAYLAHDLGYAPDGDYVVNTPTLFPVWDWSHMPPGGPRQNAMANVAIDLGAAMRRAPQMRVLSLSGYYDLSTPFFATEFDLAHLYLPSALRSNLISRHYASGHMLYLDGKTFNDVTRDVRGFIRANAD